MGEPAAASGPDLGAGIDETALRDGAPVLGHVGDEAVVLVRDGGQVHALGATCSHYGGPLAEGRVFGGAIHCPWHHACFDLATGRAHGPALAAIACFDVAIAGGKIRVGAKREVAPAAIAAPKQVVILGGGAAGVACAEALRAEGHRGDITLVTNEGSDPVDRPNLSKDFLAGNAPEEWVYLRTAAALAASQITLVRDAATSIDLAGKRVVLAAGAPLAWDALLVATGAEPLRLPIDGASLPHVHTLRTLADSRAIAALAGGRIVVIGASFIGLEAAAALTARGARVTVVGVEVVPLARVLGERVGRFVQSVHEAKGVAFRLGRKPARITAAAVELDDGTRLPADTVVMGVGVAPRLELARAAGLTIDRGVVVDDELRAAPGVWAAGDIARYPWDGERVRIEHWQVAVRHGQAVARSMLGRGARRDVPFFWSQHHDATLGYVGHAEAFDAPEVHGDLDARDAHVVYRRGGKVLAVLAIGRDPLLLEVEAAMEQRDAAALDMIIGESRETTEVPMSAMEIGKKLVELCNAGKNGEAIMELYAADVVAVEAGAPPGMSKTTTGRDAVLAKSKWWAENHTVHSSKVEGPWPHDDRFIVRFSYDITQKAGGRRFAMDEAALYTVANGKIAREEFFYTAG